MRREGGGEGRQREKSKMTDGKAYTVRERDKERK